MLKKTAKEAIVILAAATVIGLVVYAVRPDKIPPSPVANGIGESTSSAEKGFSTISIDEAVAYHEKKQAIFADARHAVDYAAGHIRGALNLAIDDSTSWLSDFVAETDPNTVIITYCDGESCHLAPELAELLYFNGFDNVFYLENGWTRWRDGGHPIIADTAPR